MNIHHHGTYSESGDIPASNLHSLAACVLLYADDADAKVGGYVQLLERAEGTKDDWVYVKDGNFSIYTR